ncbi:hypothetical protein UA08_02678 [Talaromyces atroroseus]|uniref:Chromosome segregation in meiosis protein n=1 Tax=Talaromyces atroroseus TaxID=1441469 RepID=A0A225AVP3_TALAT|nr:hypothetical protein UA08_02678 [Talaromyces atroroseus]OKL62434.1 hypothetical protein UA08_02678 [Talaromyces atroroseus]
MSDIDDLFDYDAGLDEVLKNLPSAPKNDAPKENNNASDATAVLGLDADLKVSKQRAPIAKLDETRLLSQNGIPKLRKNAKSKLKFKGKGHEFSDLGRLLNFYQLWLDDLYPRAKFADGLAMIEKLGHSRRMQIMRREWIDEGRPSFQISNGDSAPTVAAPSGLEERVPDVNVPTDNAPPDDDLDMLLAEADNRGSAPKINPPGGPDDNMQAENDVPPDDDLDMLLAEADNGSFAQKVSDSGNNNVLQDDDDLDILLAEAETLNQAGTS